MDSAEDGAVADSGPQLAQAAPKLLFLHVPEHLGTEKGGGLFHLGGDGGVVLGEVGVAAAGVYNAQIIAAGGEIKGHRADGRGIGIGEIDGDKAAHRTGGLVHQAAGLAEEDVFGILADLGNLHGGKGGSGEEIVEHRTHGHLKGGGGGEAGAPQDIGGGIGVEAAHGVAKLGKAGADAPDKGIGGALFLWDRGEAGELHPVGVVALGLEAHHRLRALGGHHNHIQVDAGGQDAAPVVVGVVAHDFGAPGGGEEGDFPLTVERRKLLQRLDIARPLRGHPFFGVELC